MANVTLSVKAKNINYIIGSNGTSDQIVLNDITVSADDGGQLTKIIKTDPEVTLSVKIST